MGDVDETSNNDVRQRFQNYIEHDIQEDMEKAFEQSLRDLRERDFNEKEPDQKRPLASLNYGDACGDIAFETVGPYEVSTYTAPALQGLGNKKRGFGESEDCSAYSNCVQQNDSDARDYAEAMSYAERNLR